MRCGAGLLALLLACIVACRAIPTPIVGPTSGYNPLTVYFSCGFALNDSSVPIDIRYSVDSPISFVSCFGTTDKSVGSGHGESVRWRRMTGQ